MDDPVLTAVGVGVMLVLLVGTLVILLTRRHSRGWRFGVFFESDPRDDEGGRDE